MSAVALPHVPSARAPSSAASSTRRSVHSASSTASRASSKSQRHSYGGGGAGDEEDEEDDGEENASEEEEEEEEEPHESSSGSGGGGLWDEVETFLNKPSPSFAALAKDQGNNKSSSAGANVLPTLRAGDRKHPVAPPGGNQSSGPRGSRPSIRQYAKQSASTKAIDSKLLQEAFAYAEKIQRVSFDDAEDDDDHQSDQQREVDRRGVGMLRRDSSFGSSGSTSGGPRIPHDAALSRQGSTRGTKGDDVKAKKKKSAASAKSSAYGASVKPTASSKKKMSSGTPAGSGGERRASSGWDASPSSTADPNGDGMAQSRKGGASAMMDQQTVQSLVSSLQHGTALDELRRELAASQQSLAMSRLVIQEAAQSFFRK